MIAINTNSLKQIELNTALRFIFNRLNCRYIELTTDGRTHGYNFIYYSERISLFDYPVEYVCLSGGWADFVIGDLSALYQQFRLLKYMNVNKIRLFVSNPKNEKPATDENFLAAIKNIREIADKHLEIILMFENHGGLTADGDLTFRLLETVNRPNVKTVFDAANYLKSGANPVKALLKVLPYIEHVHVKDIDSEGHFCSVGDGITPWFKILKILYKNGYNKAYSIEYEGEEDRFVGLEKSFVNFKKLYMEHYNE